MIFIRINLGKLVSMILKICPLIKINFAKLQMKFDKTLLLTFCVQM
jgi:hypothetical protein